MGGTIEASLIVGSFLIILLLKSCVKGVAVPLDHLVHKVDTRLEDLCELGTSLDVVSEVNILAVNLSLDIAVFTVIEPSRSVAIATSASGSLTTSTRATTWVASSKAVTPLLKENI